MGERIFVSHSTQDNLWCRPFVNMLQGLGHDVWYDEQGLSGGAEWVQSLQREVSARPVFIVILTPDAWQSRWVQEEIQLAIATNRAIMPVLLKPTVIEGFLLTRQWIDARDKDGGEIARYVTQLLNTGGVIPAPPQQKTRVAAPEVTPPALAYLGFTGLRVDGVAVITPPLCSIPAGPFILGTDPQREPNYAESENRQRTVTIAAFEIGQYPVTVAEFALAIQAGACNELSSWHRQREQPDYPVVDVSWKTAWRYAEWLSDLTGATWRLPTEEEWEKAARGTDGRIFPWGDQWDPTRANTDDGGPEHVTSIGAYAGDRSPYNVMGMAGNVQDWCGLHPGSVQLRPDAWGDKPDNRGALGGGSWNSSPTFSRCAHRSQLLMGASNDDIGFRLVRQAVIA